MNPTALKKQKGATLLDSLLYLVVGGIVTSGLYSMFGATLLASDSLSLSKEVMQLKTATASTLSKRNKYATANDINFNTVIATTGLVPQTIEIIPNGTNTVFLNKNGLNVDITSAGSPIASAFKITYSGFKPTADHKALCLNLVTALQTNDWQSVLINGIESKGFDATDITNACSSNSTYSVSFQARR